MVLWDALSTSLCQQLLCLALNANRVAALFQSYHCGLRRDTASGRCMVWHVTGTDFLACGPHPVRALVALSQGFDTSLGPSSS